MYQTKKRILPIFLFISLLFTTSSAFAVPIIGLNPGVGEQRAILEYDSSNGEFRTSDGIGTTLGGAGKQPVGYDFQGEELSHLRDILAGATFLIEEVMVSDHSEVDNDVLFQNTTGGILKLWADANQQDLLLSAAMTNGMLSGKLGGNNVRFDSQNLDIMNGELAGFFKDQSADFFIEIDNIQKCTTISKGCFLASTPFLGINHQTDALLGFSGNLVYGQVSGHGGDDGGNEEVPEPSTALLLLAGVFGGGAVRKRLTKK